MDLSGTPSETLLESVASPVVRSPVAEALPWDLYTQRINYQGPLRPTARCLHDLCTAHLRAVPYEMLEALDGADPPLEYPAVFDKLVRRRRGGTCIETTPLLGHFLRTLGFSATLVAAQMWREVSGQWWPHWDHLVLVVEADRETWLVDVGFLTLSQLAPLRISEEPQDQGGWHFRVVDEDGWRTLLRSGVDGVWKPVYRFGDEPRELDDYRWIVGFHREAEDSPLDGTVLCSRGVAGGKLIVAGDNYLRAVDGREHVEYLGDADWARRAFGEVLHGHPNLIPHAVTTWERTRADRRGNRRKIL